MPHPQKKPLFFQTGTKDATIKLSIFSPSSSFSPENIRFFCLFYDSYLCIKGLPRSVDSLTQKLRIVSPFIGSIYSHLFKWCPMSDSLLCSLQRQISNCNSFLSLFFSRKFYLIFLSFFSTKKPFIEQSFFQWTKNANKENASLGPTRKCPCFESVKGTARSSTKYSEQINGDIFIPPLT